MKDTILILGASSDVGKNLAKIYAINGDELWLAGRDVKFLSEMKLDLKHRHNCDVRCFEFDASNVETHTKFYENLPGVPTVVIWLIGLLGDQLIAESKWEGSHSIIVANYVGAVSILNIVANSFQVRKSGTIVGISSVAGERGRQSNYIYGSSKAGLTVYLSGLRNRMYHHNVHVLTVLPGFMRTKMIDEIDTPKILTASASKAAKLIYKAIIKKRNIVYVLGVWHLIMLVIKNIPEFLFKKLRL